MEAGVVAYLLCDRELDCQNCPFDLALRKLRLDAKGKQLPDIPPPLKRSADPKEDSLKAELSYEEILQAYFAALLKPSLPDDLRYSRNHLWIRPGTNGESTLGIDHVLAGLVSPIVSVVLLPRSSPLRKDEPMIWMIHSGGAVVVRSPVTGSLWEINGKIIDEPGMVRHSSYDEGWLMKVRTDTTIRDKPSFLSASQRSDQNRAELATLLQCIKDQLHSFRPLNGTLQDGGTRVQSPADMIGAKEYIRLVRHICSL